MSKVLGGIIGFCIGDALGVPVEFSSRSKLKKNPLKDMVGYGTHNQPPGTWSDDSSMLLCTIEGLCYGYNLNDMAERFCKWLYEAHWTPYNEVFDVGGTTADALALISKGMDPLKAGRELNMIMVTARSCGYCH